MDSRDRGLEQTGQMVVDLAAAEAELDSAMTAAPRADGDLHPFVVPHGQGAVVGRLHDSVRGADSPATALAVSTPIWPGPQRPGQRPVTSNSTSSFFEFRFLIARHSTCSNPALSSIAAKTRSTGSRTP